MLLDLRSLDEVAAGGTVFAYTGSGGITFGGVATTAPRFTYAYFPGRLIATHVDADFNFATFDTFVLNDGSVRSTEQFSVGLSASGPGITQSIGWVTAAGFPGLGADLSFPPNNTFPTPQRLLIWARHDENRTTVSLRVWIQIYDVANSLKEELECSPTGLTVSFQPEGSWIPVIIPPLPAFSVAAVEDDRFAIKLEFTNDDHSGFSTNVVLIVGQLPVAEAVSGIAVTAHALRGFWFTGAATLKRTFAYAVAAAGITFGGTGTVKLTKAYAVTSGGITFGGASTSAQGHAWAGTGGIIFSGHATEKHATAYTVVTGGIVFSGIATTSTTASGAFSYAGSGGIRFGGAATIRRIEVDQPSRGWFRYRFDLRAKVITPEDLRLAISSASASASASAPISGIEVVAELVPARGYADVSISVSVPLSDVDADLEIGIIRVVAEATVVNTGIQSNLEISASGVSSSARVSVVGVVATCITGIVSVSIGPDEVLDELLFLLEVA